MKRTYLMIATILVTGATFASESKVICGAEVQIGSNYFSIGNLQAIRLNESIILAKREGFEIVSAPAPINSKGTTLSLCVTVTKP